MADSVPGSAPVASSTGASAPPAGGTATPSPGQVLPRVAQGNTPEAPARVTPPEGTTLPASAVRTGEPPRERWNDILANARQKTRTEVEAEYQQRFEPYKQFEEDPWGAVQNWLERASSHSHYGPILQDYFSKRGQARQAQAPQEPKPDVPIVNEQGQVTSYTYSADALKQWREWNNSTLQQQFDEKFRPIEQREAQRQQRETVQEIRQEADRMADTTLGELRQVPHFKENEALVRQAMVDHPEWGANPHRAFNYVLQTHVLPNLSRAEQGRTIEALTGKGSGNTIAPGSTVNATPKFKNFGEAARYFEAHPEEAAAQAGRRRSGAQQQ